MRYRAQTVGCSKRVKAFSRKLPPSANAPRAVTISQKCKEAVLISCNMFKLLEIPHDAAMHKRCNVRVDLAHMHVLALA